MRVQQLIQAIGWGSEHQLQPLDNLTLGLFGRGCELRFQAACVNALDAREVSHAPPRVVDLRLLVREGGRNLIEMPEQDLYARACAHGWMHACGKTQASN